jgi:hypothetical protein
VPDRRQALAVMSTATTLVGTIVTTFREALDERFSDYRTRFAEHLA